MWHCFVREGGDKPTAAMLPSRIWMASAVDAGADSEQPAARMSNDDIALVNLLNNGSSRSGVRACALNFFASNRYRYSLLSIKHESLNGTAPAPTPIFPQN